MKKTETSSSPSSLSVAVLLGWNYFYAAPQAEKQRQTQQTDPADQRPTSGTQPASPSQAGGPATPLPGTVPAWPRPVVETREAALARSPRVAIDTPSIRGSISLQGRPHRRRLAQELPRDRRPEEPEHRAVLALRQPASLLRGVRLGRGAARSLPGPDTVWTRRQPGPDPGPPGDPHLGQRPGTDLPPDDHGRRQVDVHGQGHASRTRARRAVTLHPYSLVSRHGRPATLGYYVLARGPDRRPRRPGPAGIHLRQARQGSPSARPEHPRQGLGQRHRRLRRHHRQVLGRGRRSPTRPGPSRAASASATRARRKVYQANILGDGARRRARRHARRRRSASSPARRRSRVVDGYKDSLSIKNFDLLIDWGWFYFITKPLFKVLDFFYHLVGNFGVVDPDRHGAPEAAVLPARQQVLQRRWRR